MTKSQQMANSLFKGHIWQPEWKNYKDSKTGVEIRQLTNYKGHSHHLYFTNSGWYDQGQKLLFSSDRQNRTNLFSIDLETGEITQLTDLEPIEYPYETRFLSACLNPTRSEAYFWYNQELVALSLKTLQTRTLYKIPRGFLSGILSCTADGKYICTGIFEDLSKWFRVDLLRGYVGFYVGVSDIWEAKPLSWIIRIATDGSDAEIVWEEKNWIGHVNTSPTQPNLLTFCHEGPWDKVDNRIWGLDLTTRKVWMIRPRENSEQVGHEYWFADGIYIGYHGMRPDGEKFIGKIRYDNTDRFEISFPHKTGHTHSNDFSLVVGDGEGIIRLWKLNGKKFNGQRILCEHKSSWHIQQVHPHPRFSPDGKQILFTSDMSGYGNLYLVKIPKFESLPEVKGIAKVQKDNGK